MPPGHAVIRHVGHEAVLDRLVMDRPPRHLDVLANGELRAGRLAVLLGSRRSHRAGYEQSHDQET